MAEYPCTRGVAKITPLLQEIRTLAVPPKADPKGLKQAGFTSFNDSALLQILKFIGFTNDSDVPTDLWRRFRGADHRKALAKGIRGGYAALFSHFPDPQDRTEEELRDFLKVDAPALPSERLSRIIKTFKTLAQEADFSATPRSPAPSPDPPVGKVRTSAPTVPESRTPAGLSPRQEGLFQESRDCADNGSYRAAHVMAWAAFMDCLEDMLASDGLRKVFAAHPSWAKWATIEELRQNVSESQLIDVAGDVGLLLKNDMKVLHGLLAERNECAHPSAHAPGCEEAVGYIANLRRRLEAIQKKSL